MTIEQQQQKDSVPPVILIRVCVSQRGREREKIANFSKRLNLILNHTAKWIWRVFATGTFYCSIQYSLIEKKTHRNTYIRSLTTPFKSECVHSKYTGSAHSICCRRVSMLFYILYWFMCRKLCTQPRTVYDTRTLRMEPDTGVNYVVKLKV